MLLRRIFQQSPFPSSESEKSYSTEPVERLEKNGTNVTVRATPTQEPRETYPAPEKNGISSLQAPRYKAFSLYRRVFTTVFVANLATIIWILGLRHETLNKLAIATAANFMVAVLMRRDHVVNALFKIFCSVPTSAPLFIRQNFARIFHIALVKSPEFWSLIIATSSIILPWLTLRKVRAIKEADKNAIIHDTKAQGRPDLVALSYRLYKESGSEAITAKDIPLSPSQIDELIQNGHAIVIFGGRVLRIDTWLDYHPGGEKAILHMVGKDATDEINAFHSESAKKQMLRYQIGKIEKKWVNLMPPIQKASSTLNIQEYGTNSPTNSDPPRANGQLKLNKFSVASKETGFCQNIQVKSRERRAPLTLTNNIELDNLRARDNTTNLDEEQLERLTQSFRSLIDKMEAAGLYDCHYWAYFNDATRIVLIFLLMLLLLHSGWYCSSAAIMGCFWHQLVFVAHDAGHMGITHNYHIDTLIGMVVANHIGGLSLGWWKRSHNIHHLVTNSPSHDPDIEHLPFLAISPTFFKSLYSTYYDKVMPYTKVAQAVIPYQAWLYYLFLSFGRFNLYALSWDYLFNDLGPRSNRWHRLFEISGHIFFWIWFGYYLLYLSIPTWSLRIAFVMISHMVTMPLHVQFTLSHFAMSTSTPGPSEPWPQQQLRTTMDVDCPTWLDWFHGGLQFQAVHHLFPRMPRHNLRKASGYVREWSLEVGLKYEIYGFGECNGRVISRLGEVARQARFLKECQESVIKKGEFLHGDWE
ncbi:hypothetical protein G7Y89_g691 [Cudoniella acicularis]|uniref:Delta 8-(E)-sphingolipid desaturase n=1 Tax=Cudoniella acicularis TaxID=354080 RepID=A0A8H4RYD3_9HELO|nr:hypothetical protein G7Y89_g691 [Cudoniella acicularis]